MIGIALIGPSKGQDLASKLERAEAALAATAADVANEAYDREAVVRERLAELEAEASVLSRVRSRATTHTT